MSLNAPAASQSEALALLVLHLAHQSWDDKISSAFNNLQSFESVASIFAHKNYLKHKKDAETILGKYDRREILFWSDPDYPKLLKEISDAPLVLFLRGNRRLLANEAVSIVGTREPSADARLATESITRWFVAQGKMIVSGIARGVDAIAHHTALSCGGATCAVLPNGADHAYPLVNRDLYAAAKTSERLLLVSEYAPHEKPQRFQFVRRNRIIAGFSMLTVVTQAGVRSGSLITVNHALDQGRDVASVHYRHGSEASNAGGEKLLADGAQDLGFLHNPR